MPSRGASLSARLRSLLKTREMGQRLRNSYQEPGWGTNRFRLQVVMWHPDERHSGNIESFENLSMTTPDPKGRFVEDVINEQSNLSQRRSRGGKRIRREIPRIHVIASI